MLAELVTLAVTIGLIYLIYSLHRRFEVIKNRRSKREPALLESIGFDPDQHELVVRLTHGGTITGTPHPQGPGSLKDGILLIGARTNEGDRTPSALTFVPSQSVTAVGTATRSQQQDT